MPEARPVERRRTQIDGERQQFGDALDLDRHDMAGVLEKRIRHFLPVLHRRIAHAHDAVARPDPGLVKRRVLLHLAHARIVHKSVFTRGHPHDEQEHKAQNKVHHRPGDEHRHLNPARL